MGKSVLWVSKCGEVVPISIDNCIITNFAGFLAHVVFFPVLFLTSMHLFLKVLILSQEFHKSKKKKKIVLSSKTLPGSSLRARSLTAPPHPFLPPIPAARDLARRLDPLPSLPFPSLPFPFPFPSHPFPLPSLRPLPISLSTYPPLPIYLSTSLSIYLALNLPIYLSTYPPPTCPLSLPSPRPAPGPVYQLPLPIPVPRPFIFPLLAPSPPRSKPRSFFFFSFFMLIRRDSNPSPLCLPINYQFNAYANCAIPARLRIQWFFCMLFICKSNSCP